MLDMYILIDKLGKNFGLVLLLIDAKP